MESIRKEKYYTYSDYAKWDDDERCELIDGVVYMMSPAPTRRHQNILGKLFIQFTSLLQGKPFKVYIAPFDVRLNAEEEDDIVVQPDLLVICDKSKLTDEGSIGAPDLMIEILSPSTAYKDKSIKFRKYLKYGVREYWMVDPLTDTIQACVLENGKYTISVYTVKDMAPVHILGGGVIDVAEIFAE